jgi:hypothetical protein
LCLSASPSSGELREWWRLGGGADFVEVVADFAGGLDGFGVGDVGHVDETVLVILAVERTTGGRFVTVGESVAADDVRMAEFLYCAEGTA